MDLDLVLEITPEELEEFPEVTETEPVSGVNEEGTIVPDCNQHSLQTRRRYTHETPLSPLTPLGETLQTGASRDRGTQKKIS